MKTIYWGRAKSRVLKIYSKQNFPCMCRFCGSFYHRDQIERHERFCKG